MKYVVLYSGGPDSLISLEWARSQKDATEVTPIYFNLGHRYAVREMLAVQATEPSANINPALSQLGLWWEEDDAHIYARNAFLCMAASKYLPPEGGSIVLTVQKDELSIPDRSPSFLMHMETVLGDFRDEVKIPTPWATMDKTDMVAWYLSADLDEDKLCDTTSCYAGSPDSDDPVMMRTQCGECAACFRRYVAFSLNGIDESYRLDPRRSKLAREYVDRALRGTYSPDRCRRILSAMGA